MCLWVFFTITWAKGIRSNPQAVIWMDFGKGWEKTKMNNWSLKDSSNSRTRARGGSIAFLLPLVGNKCAETASLLRHYYRLLTTLLNDLAIPYRQDHGNTMKYPEGWDRRSWIWCPHTAQHGENYFHFQQQVFLFQLTDLLHIFVWQLVKPTEIV